MMIVGIPSHRSRAQRPNYKNLDLGRQFLRLKESLSISFITQQDKLHLGLVFLIINSDYHLTV